MAATEPEREAEKVADATATIRTDRYHVDLQARRHALAADEPADQGGADTGPPFGLLLSGLGPAPRSPCGWTPTASSGPWRGRRPARLHRQGPGHPMDRPADHRARALGDDQRARLAEIAEKTPVTKAVRAGTEIRTTVAQRPDRRTALAGRKTTEVSRR